MISRDRGHNINNSSLDNDIKISLGRRQRKRWKVSKRSLNIFSFAIPRFMFLTWEGQFASLLFPLTSQKLHLQGTSAKIIPHKLCDIYCFNKCRLKKHFFYLR